MKSFMWGAETKLVGRRHKIIAPIRKRIVGKIKYYVVGRNN